MTVDSRFHTTVDKKWHCVARERRLRWRSLVLLAVMAAVAVVVFTHMLWLRVVGRFLVVADDLQTADAAIALSGGGRGRVTDTVSIFEKGYAKWLVVTNMPLNVPGVRESFAELARREAVWQGMSEESILIAPGVVRTTYEEALAVRRLAQEQGWRTLLVVTDPFHTRRTRLIFRDAFRGTDLTIVVRPVRNHRYQPDTWWRDRDSLRETWTEYLKMVLYLLGYR